MSSHFVTDHHFGLRLNLLLLLYLLLLGNIGPCRDERAEECAVQSRSMVRVNSDITKNRRNVFHEVDDLLLILDILLEFRSYELERLFRQYYYLFDATIYLEQTQDGIRQKHKMRVG